jgi:hypothetical protein
MDAKWLAGVEGAVYLKFGSESITGVSKQGG